MKKSIIALAILATMTAQADETTLYGNVSGTVIYTDTDMSASVSNAVTGDDDNTHSSTIIEKSASFGIKGGESLGNGNEAFYKVEAGFGDESLTTKKAYVGLKNASYGSVSIGKQSLAIDTLGDFTDPFNTLTPGSRALGTGSDAAVVYVSPDMGGLKISGSVEADGTGVGSLHTHADKLDIVAKYEANGISAGVGMTRENAAAGSPIIDENVDVVTAAVGYGNENFEVGVLTDVYSVDDEDDTYWVQAGALYNVNPSDAIYIGASSHIKDLEDAQGNDIDDPWDAAIGYQHKFSKRTKMWTEYSFSDADQNEANNLAIGLKTQF